MTGFLLPLGLPLVAWYLIARLIHAETLPGDRQFWITRPYRWQSLLGAKVLFVLVFLNLPMTVADAAERSPSACVDGFLMLQYSTFWVISPRKVEPPSCGRAPTRENRRPML